LSAAEADWLTDYDQAVKQAISEKKDLVILFQKDEELEKAMKNAKVKERLARIVCLKLPVDYKRKGEGLLDHSALEGVGGRPGLAIVSYHDKELATHGYVISAHPLARSRYAWAPSYGAEQVKLILDLPRKATLTQRSMIYAVSVHPEQPQSVYSELHPACL